MKGTINCILWNANGLNPTKCKWIYNRGRKFRTKLYLFTEIHNHCPPNLGSGWICKFFKNNDYTGIGLIHSDDISINIVSCDINTRFLILEASLKNSKKKTKIMIIYAPPSSTRWNSWVHKMKRLLCDSSIDIICGDFNWTPDPTVDRFPTNEMLSPTEKELSFWLRHKTDICKNFMIDSSISISDKIQKYHTFRRSNLSSRIDLIFSKNPDLCKFRYILDSYIPNSDHMPICFKITLDKNIKSSRNWKFSPFAWNCRTGHRICSKIINSSFQNISYDNCHDILIDELAKKQKKNPSKEAKIDLQD